MFASRPIKAGELIIEERPLFVTRINVDETSDGTFEQAALEHLAPETVEKFLGLSNAQDAHIHPLVGILLTNNFAVSQGRGGTRALQGGANASTNLQIDFDYESSDEMLGGGVYEFICRANQDCVPSTRAFPSFPSPAQETI